MGESAIVIILILIILVMALVFTTKSAEESYRDQAARFDREDAVETAQTITNLFELKCDKEGLKTTCVDKHKALAFASLLDTNQTAQTYYDGILGNSEITLEQVYPVGENITLYAKNASNTSQVAHAFQFPVSIHNASADAMAFGVLKLERYYKEVGG